MMDLSFLSTHESSMSFADKTQSFLQVDSQFSEYSKIVEYQPDSKIVEICKEFREITKSGSEHNNYMTMINNYIENLSHYHKSVLHSRQLLPQNYDSELQLISSLINNEIKTWKLMNQLYEDRFDHISAEIKAPMAKISELDLLHDLYENNTQLRESQIVIDWLEDFMRDTLDNNSGFFIGSDGKSWEHTKHNIRRGNTFTANELDPDAPLRGKLNLTDSDKNDENEYLRYIFHCLQCGDFDKAQLLSQNHDEWWRSLSLDGWKPFHNPLIADEHCDNNDVTGNSNRDGFKSVCFQLSEDTQLNIYERAIYALLCGNINVLSLVQKDWHGLLWAYLKAYTEHVVDDYLHTFTINGSFATQSLFGDEDIDLCSLGLGGKTASNETLAHRTREQIFDDIATKLVHSPIDTIKSGIRFASKPNINFYRSIFEVVQQYIIVNDIEGLIFYIELALSKLPKKKSSADKLMLRFLAHVIIFIYSIHVDLQITVYHKVLEHYIENLIEENSVENISFYVSKLSTDLQIKWYSKCMAGVTDYDEKRRCILDGLEYDLPIIEISRLVVQSIRLNTATESSTLSASFYRPIDQSSSNNGFVTDGEKVKIAGLDWLTIVPDQYPHLVRQSNALCRVMLDSDKLQAAKMVLNKTTKEIMSKLQSSTASDTMPRWLSAVIYENNCLKAYVAAYDAYADWHNHFSNQKPAKKDFNVHRDLNKLSFHEKQLLQKEFEEYTLSMQQWEKSAQYHGNRVMDSFVDMLAMGERGWLSDTGVASDWIETDTTEGEQMSAGRDNDCWQRRLEQIERLRKTTVVQVAFLLLRVMGSSGRNDRCFELTNMLADESLGLFEHFERAQLQKLLQQVRQCSLALMNDGDDPLGL